MTPLPLPKARRLGMMLALCLMVEASAPAPALAWIAWLDEWSGPGPFWGLLYEARLLCFGPDNGVAKLVERLQQAQLTTQAFATKFSIAGASQRNERIEVTPDVVADW